MIDTNVIPARRLYLSIMIGVRDESKLFDYANSMATEWAVEPPATIGEAAYESLVMSEIAAKVGLEILGRDITVVDQDVDGNLKVEVVERA